VQHTSLETNRLSPRGGMPVNPASPGKGRCAAEPAKPSPATFRQNTPAYASRPRLAASRLQSGPSIRCDIGQIGSRHWTPTLRAQLGQSQIVPCLESGAAAENNVREMTPPNWGQSLTDCMKEDI
jgi:hypothetical protein